MTKHKPVAVEEVIAVLSFIEDAMVDPSLLDPATSPYDDDVTKRVAKLLQVSVIQTESVDKEKNPVGRPSQKTVLPISEVEAEVDEIRKEIAQLKVDAKGLETKDRIDIIKTRAALVEKIIGMKERITNIKQQRAFITDVMMLLEDVMEQSQREEFIKRLQPYLEA